ncbi:MAG: aminopeptidase P family protein [Deferribacterota bacterium]|nr:aminopeptidase P family protein [Deferribacterota bacterium]
MMIDKLAERRRKKIINRLGNNIDYILLLPGKNLYYLTGIDLNISLDRPFVYILDTSDAKSYIIAPKLHEAEIDKNMFSDCKFYTDLEDPFDIISSFFKANSSIAVEKNIPLYIYDNISKKANLETITYIDSIISDERKIKDNIEISNILKAVYIVDETFERLVKEPLKGKCEREIAALIEYIMKSLGAENYSFETIVAVSENAANPHHKPGERTFNEGDSLVIDFGAIYKNYCSDITRTIFCGEPPEKVKNIYNIVKEANEKAIDAIKLNNEISIIDKAARDIISNHGYGDYFIHRTGHGIGLDVHEAPVISLNNNENVLEGMVFTVEPGIYLPEELGVRIEDDILITNKGANILTKSTKDLLIVS